jgi:hypothetical protein
MNAGISWRLRAKNEYADHNGQESQDEFDPTPDGGTPNRSPVIGFIQSKNEGDDKGKIDARKNVEQAVEHHAEVILLSFPPECDRLDPTDCRWRNNSLRR